MLHRKPLRGGADHHELEIEEHADQRQSSYVLQLVTTVPQLLNQAGAEHNGRDETCIIALLTAVTVGYAMLFQG